MLFEIEQRLEIELELAALDRCPKVAFDHAPRLGLLVEAFLEETVDPPPVALGAIQGEVGIAQQCSRSSAVVGRNGDADTGLGMI